MDEAALDPERALALTYVPASARARVETLWRLDERIARLGAATSQFREVKLAWWEEQLAALTPAGHAEPLLAQAARDLLPTLRPTDLASLADAWRFVEEHAFQPGYVTGRAGLFTLTARLMGTDPPQAADAELWARADLRRRRPDLVPAGSAKISSRRWPKPVRALGALVILAARDLSAPEPEPPTPARVARMAWHRLTGL